MLISVRPSVSLFLELQATPTFLLVSPSQTWHLADEDP